MVRSAKIALMMLAAMMAACSSQGNSVAPARNFASAGVVQIYGAAYDGNFQN